jgi:hypothetical protein
MLLNAIIEQSKTDFQFLMHDLELHLLIGGSPKMGQTSCKCSYIKLQPQELQLSTY